MRSRRCRRWSRISGTRWCDRRAVQIFKKILSLDNTCTNVVVGGGDVGNVVTRILCIRIVTIREVGTAPTCEDDDGDIHYTHTHTWPIGVTLAARVRRRRWNSLSHCNAVRIHRNVYINIYT